MAQMIKLVFADYRYIILAAAIFVGMLIPLSIISEFIFLEPYIIAHIPSGGEINFFLILVVSALSGLVLAMSGKRFSILESAYQSFLERCRPGPQLGQQAGACSCG